MSLDKLVKNLFSDILQIPKAIGEGLLHGLYTPFAILSGVDHASEVFKRDRPLYSFFYGISQIPAALLANGIYATLIPYWGTVATVTNLGSLYVVYNKYASSLNPATA